MGARAGVSSGRYEIGPLLAHGGMADVHRGLDTVSGRPVAVKLLNSCAPQARERARFATEVEALSRLAHPGVVQLLDADLDADPPYLVMELCTGSDLETRIAQGALPAPLVADLAVQLAEALAHAHEQGVVHRDIKPSNVLLTEDGRCLLADFGIARLLGWTSTVTRSGQTLGSPAYLAPEQLASSEVSPAADIYAFGLVLLEALTGQPAFTGPALEVAQTRLYVRPLLPVSLGPAWLRLIEAMTSPDPGERPTAAEIAGTLRGLKAYAGTRPAATRTLTVLPAIRPRPGRRARPRPRRVAGLAAAVVLAGLASAAEFLPGQEPARSGPPAVSPHEVQGPETPGPTRSAEPRARPADRSPAGARQPPAKVHVEHGHHGHGHGHAHGKGGRH